MEKVYAYITHWTDLLLQKKRTLFVLGGLAVFLTLSAVSIFILLKFPNSGDEYLYLYQARTFLAGRFSNPAHPLQHFFKFTWILFRKNRVFCHFLPGWPLFLAVGMVLKIPAYLIGPLVGTLSLGALFLLGKKIYTPRIALIAVLLTFFSSFFIFNAASYFSHTPCSLLLILFVYVSLRFEETSRTHAGLLSGFLFAAAFITRPFSALLCGLPMFLHLLPGLLKAPRKLLPLLSGALPVFSFLLFYDYQLTGNPFSLPMLLVKQNRQWGVSILQVQTLIYYLKKLFLWMPVSFPVLYFASLCKGLTARKTLPSGEILLGSFFLFQILGQFFFIPTEGNAYGPRYYYESFPFLVLFITAFLFKETTYSQKGILGKLLFVFFLISLPLSVPPWINHLKTERAVILERSDLYRTVELQRIQNAIIFIGSGTGTIRPMKIYDLTRNDGDYQNSVLYAIDHGRGNRALMSFYPDRTYYHYHYDKRLRQGSLKRLAPFPRR